MNLRITRIGKKGTLLVGAPRGRHIATLCIGGKKKNIPITARRQHDSICGMGGNFTGNKVANDDSLRMAVHHDDIEHLGAWMHQDRSQGDLPAKRLIGAQKQLLASLASSIKSAGNLRPAKRSIGKQAAVLSRERHALGDALIDDV